MTPEVPVALVWLAPTLPDAQAARTLAAWGRAHGIALVEPVDGAPATLPDSLETIDRVEELLDRAHDAMAAHDGGGIDAALAAATEMLRRHPELPNAAWLMAELERARAARWRQMPPTDTAAANSAWMRAESLDKGRLAGVAEEAAPTHPDQAIVAVSAIPPGERLWFDGKALAGGDEEPTRAGLHAVSVTWRGAPVWATWVDVAIGRSSLALASPRPPPCSLAELRLGWSAGGGLSVGPAVQCPRWVIATAGPFPGTIRVAACTANRCDALLDWQPSSPTWVVAPAAEPHPTGHGPAWATWGVVAAGVAAASGLAVLAVFAASGSLGTRTTETHFVSGGLKVP